jgi:hypothetical protein
LEWKVVVICMHSINMLRIAHISPREGLWMHWDKEDLIQKRGYGSI